MPIILLIQVVGFGVLALLNLFYTVYCTQVVLENPPPEPHPVLNPQAASHDAFCACILFSSGCFNLAVAFMRIHLAQGGFIADWSTAICFASCGLLNYFMAYLFMKARLGVKRECSCDRSLGSKPV